MSDAVTTHIDYSQRPKKEVGRGQVLFIFIFLGSGCGRVKLPEGSYDYFWKYSELARKPCQICVCLADEMCENVAKRIEEFGPFFIYRDLKSQAEFILMLIQ